MKSQHKQLFSFIPTRVEKKTEIQISERSRKLSKLLCKWWRIANDGYMGMARGMKKCDK